MSDPRIVAVGVPCPLDKVLDVVLTADLHDLLHLVESPPLCLERLRCREREDRPCVCLYLEIRRERELVIFLARSLLALHGHPHRTNRPINRVVAIRKCEAARRGNPLTNAGRQRNDTLVRNDGGARAACIGWHCRVRETAREHPVEYLKRGRGGLSWMIGCGDLL
jgi:hypothetical protein